MFLGVRARLGQGPTLLRTFLRVLVVVGILATVLAGAIGFGQEEKNVQIDTLSVLDTLYHLSGGGGNGLVLIDEINGGVVLVDTKLPGWGQPVLDAVGQVTDLPVTAIINSHAHQGHAGSNAEYPEVTRIIAHERTGDNMSRMELYTDADSPGLGVRVHRAQRQSRADQQRPR